MVIKLSSHNFFQTYALSQKARLRDLSKTDRKIAIFSTVLLGIFSAGLAPLTLFALSKLKKKNPPVQITHPIPFNPNPPEYPNYTAIEKNQADAFLKKIPQTLELQKIAQKLIQNIQYLSLEELKKNLQYCLLQLETRLHDEFAIGFNIGTKEQWVASLASVNFTQYPSGWFKFTANRDQEPDHSLTIGTVPQDQLVVFQDCLFSIKQLQFLNSLYQELLDKDQVKTLYLVIPFMTDYAKNEIKGLIYQFKDHLKLDIITSEQKIHSIKDHFTSYEIRQLFFHFQENFLYNEEAAHRTLCYTQWSYPPESYTVPSLPTFIS